MTPTDRLSGFGLGLATNSDSVERVPRGQNEHYWKLRRVPIGLFRVARLLTQWNLRKSDDPRRGAGGHREIRRCERL